MKSKTEIADAIKAVNAKRKPNYMIIKISWNNQLVVPYEAGLTIMAALKDAEVYCDDYGKDPMITPLPQDGFRSSILAPEFYEDIKVAQLLGIKVEELHAAKMHTPEPETV
jgi:hypothetical protein